MPRLPLDGILIVGINADDLPSVLLLKLLQDQGATVNNVDIDVTTLNDEELSLSFRHLIDEAVVVVLGSSSSRESDVAALRKSVEGINKSVITCEMPAFPKGVSFVGNSVVSDGVIAALAGVYSAAGGEPVYTPLAIPSVFAALGAAIGVAAAIVWRHRTGSGQHVESSRLGSSLLALGASALKVRGQLSGGRPDDPWWSPFICRDGGWIWLSLPTRKFVRRFVEALELDPSLIAMTSWSASDSDSALTKGTPERLNLDALLAEIFVTRDSADWESFGRVIDVPFTRVWDVPERGMASGVAVDLKPLVANATSVDLVNILPDEPRFPLEGIKVVDFAQVLAGPVAGRILAELGASVLKVNNPAEDGAGYKWNVLRYHADVNRGKESVHWDLKSERGRACAEKALHDADVVIHNFRDSAVRDLGLHPEQLAVSAPKAVQVVISAFGRDASRAGAPGYELNAQCISGMVAGSRTDGDRPRLQPLAINDYGTGLLAAFGALVSLISVFSGGARMVVHASLADTARLIVGASTDAGSVSLGARNATLMSAAEPVGIYQTNDSWVYVEASEAQVWSVLQHESKGSGSSKNLQSDRTVKVRSKCRSITSADLIVAMGSAGISACEVRTRSDVMEDPWARESGAVIDWSYDGNDLTTVGFPVHLSASPVVVTGWCSKPGSDNELYVDG